MDTDRLEIIDVHLHAWWIRGMEAYDHPHQPATLDEKVFRDTLAQMDQLGISHGVLSGPNNVTSE